MTEQKQKKSAADRAQEALDVAERKWARLRDKRDQLQSELSAVERDVAAAESRRDYLAADPDLPRTETETDKKPEPDF